MKLHFFYFSVFVLFQSIASAGLLYPFHRLATKDLDQMNKVIKEKIKESKASAGNQTIPLKEALQAVFSRPNDDGMIEKLLPAVRNELDEHDAYEKTFTLLVKEASGALKNPKAFRPEALLTYMIFLENTLSEMKPRLIHPFEKGIFTQIRDAEIKYSKELLQQRKLRMLKDYPSPSEMAASFLKEFAEKQLAEEKIAAEKAKSAGSTPAPETQAAPLPAEQK